MILPNPVWPEVKVCQSTMLPAFRSAAEAKSFHEKNAPRGKINELFYCADCQHFHYTASAPSPSGDSSGTSRSSKDYQKAFHELKTKL